jgi:hypothetical protein
MNVTDRIVLEAVVAPADGGITFEEIVDLPDFDDDELDEVVASLAWLRDGGAIYQRDDGGPPDDFELRYYPTLEGIFALVADDEGLTADEAQQQLSKP